MDSYQDKESADEFLDRVNDITGRVEAILAGDVTVTAEEERFFEERKIKAAVKDIRKREAVEKV